MKQHKHQKELTLLKAFFTSSAIMVATGFLISIDQASLFAQTALLVHLVTMPIWLGITAYYLVKHFIRTVGSRQVNLNFSGIFGILQILTIAISGFILFVQFSKNVSLIHFYASLTFLVIFILHIALSKKLIRQAKVKASIPQITHDLVVKGGALIFAICLFCSMALLLKTPLEESAILSKENYQNNYGDNVFAPSNTTTENQQFIQHDYIGRSEDCQSCHQDIYQQWQDSTHRLAAQDPTYVRNINLLESKKGIVATRYCEGCHAPVALLSGDLTEGGSHGGMEGTMAFNEGVSCKSCHSISHINSTEGVASYHYSPATSHLMPISSFAGKIITESLPQHHQEDFSVTASNTSKFCASCHAQFMDERMNNWGWVKMQDEYTAWLNSPYSGKGNDTHQGAQTRCQDCHMPLVPSNDPSANEDGLVFSHRFPGGNNFLAEHFALDQQNKETLAFMQSNKMRISIEEPRRKDAVETTLTVSQNLKQHHQTPYFAYLGETLNLNILVSNIGVGHDFPGGTIDLQEAWVHLEVRDAQMRLISEAGSLDDGLRIADDTTIYKSIPVNRQGHHVWRHDLFNMSGKSYRNVVKAGETDRIEMPLTIPAWAKSPVSIIATLKYRKLNPKYYNWVMQDKEKKPTKIIDVARSALSIPVLIEPPVQKANAML